MPVEAARFHHPAVGVDENLQIHVALDLGPSRLGRIA
jgi:hypothetical protein